MAEIKNNRAKKFITRLRNNRSNKAKGVNTSKYCGTVKFTDDALAIQKRLRDEWQ